MQSWLESHHRTKVTSTDAWYLDFANKLISMIDSSGLYTDKTWAEKQFAAKLLTLYLEDCVAEDGGWHHFCKLYFKRYGDRLPFFVTPEDYIPDEINKVDIAFILWTINCRKTSHLVIADPFDENTLELAAQVYTFLDEYFEQAPICDIPSNDWVMLSEQLIKDKTMVPEIESGIKLPNSVELFLKASDGQQLMYFPCYEDMESFFINHLHWKAADLPDKLGAEEGNIVVYANPKGLLVAPGVACFFCDKRNETYDSTYAVNEGYKVFTEQGYCPFDLVKYAVEHKLFPDIRLPFKNGKDILWNNWDFIARYFLGEFYEGD